MADGRLRTVMNQLRRLHGGRGAALTDARLLEDFVTRRDEASFEVLVWRHGLMVLNLCQRVLRDAEDAEDAFQATFLVFARKAGSIGKGEALASWLYKVAYRVALRLRARSAKRNAREEAIDDLPAPADGDDVQWRDLRPVLDEEINRLPEKYRAPFVLCYLQGHTNEEAAQRLGCPKGTILSRLARGRERLRSRLVRRGVALSVGCLAALVAQNASSAALPAALVKSTARAALAFAAKQAMTGLVSTTVLALTEGVLQTMFLTKLKIAAAALLALAVAATGFAWGAHQALAQRPPDSKPAIAAAPADEANQQPRREESKGPEIIGKVIAVAKDGKSFTLEIPPAARGDEAKKVEVKLDDKTAVAYQWIGPDGAKPTEGYQAKVQLAEGSKEVAAKVQFAGTLNFRAADLTGRVTGVAKGGKGLTMEMARDPSKTVDVKFTDKTQVRFYFVGVDQAKLVEGMIAQVWLADDTKDTAYRVQLQGMEPGGRRDGKGPPLTGRVVAVSADGKTLTVESSREGRGEEPKRVEVKIGPMTGLVFGNVEAGGARIVEDMQASVWLRDGSTDRAVRISLVGKEKEDPAQLAGKVSAVGKDGKTITLEVGEANPGRTGKPKQVEIKLGDKTRIAYTNVGPNSAKPTEGYYANVRLADGSKDTAGQILFSGPLSARGR